MLWRKRYGQTCSEIFPSRLVFWEIFGCSFWEGILGDHWALPLGNVPWETPGNQFIFFGGHPTPGNPFLFLSQSSDPANPANPADLADPAEPADPAESAEPAEPADPTGKKKSPSIIILIRGKKSNEKNNHKNYQFKRKNNIQLAQNSDLQLIHIKKYKYIYILKIL